MPISSWPRASKLSEILEIYKAEGSPTPLSAAEARETVIQWREKSLVGEQTFAQRLQAADLTVLELGNALAMEAQDELPSGEPPPWVHELDALLGNSTSAPGEAQPTAGPDLAQAPFSPFFTPFLHRAQQWLGHTQRQPGEPGQSGDSVIGLRAAQQLLHQLLTQMGKYSLRTLTLDLNIKRLQGELRGSTAKERLLDYSTRFLAKDRERRQLLSRYPVLARLLTQAVENWLESSTELLQRFRHDRLALGRAMLAGKDPGPIVEIQTGIGDAHCRGRQVVAVRTESGLRLIYKPRPLGIDRVFQQILTWLNELGLKHPLRRLSIVDRGDYGWIEWVEHASCSSSGEVVSYFHRLGNLLGLTWLMRGADLHFENLIAAGEHPVLIDLECLMHPEATVQGEANATTQALLHLDRSVLRIGLLPMLVLGHQVDISALAGGREGQEMPYRTLALQGEGSDSMRYAQRPAIMKQAQNRVLLDGEPVEFAPYAEQIVQGFEECVALVRKEKTSFLELLDALASVPVRFLGRETSRYAQVLSESHHPDYLRRGRDRDRLLEQLWAEVERRPSLALLTPHEVQDLWFGDIPYFVSRSGSRDLWTSRGQRLAKVFSTTSLERARSLINGLDETAVQRQTSYIRDSLALSSRQAEGRHSGAHDTSHPPGSNRDPLAPEQLVDQASRIGDQLLESSIRGRDGRTWLGVIPSHAGASGWMLAPLQADLYTGLGGVAMFLAYLGELTDRSSYRELAEAAINTLWEIEDSLGPEQQRPIGAFTGLASQLYLLQHIGALWGPSGLGQRLQTVTRRLRERITKDRDCDLLAGSAGAVVVLLSLHRQTGDDHCLQLARQCGDHLLSQAVAQEPGIAWPSADAKQPLTGFSHGTAGIAWSLLELHHDTGDSRYRVAAQQALAYERAHFLPAHGNWADLRQYGSDRGFHSWCHGAPGIALSRLLMGPLLPEDDVLAEELRIALETTVEIGFGHGHCLCHGDLGNGEILHLAGEELDEERWRDDARRSAARAVQEATGGELWRCGIASGKVQSPSLMLGLSGIGHALLRLAAPEQVPSVLALQPPAVAAKQLARLAPQSVSVKHPTQVRPSG